MMRAGAGGLQCSDLILKWRVLGHESGAERGSAGGCRRKRCGECVQAQLTVQISARAEVKLVKTGDGSENPGRIHKSTERCQFFRERSIAQDGFFQFGRKFKEIGEQAVKDAELVLEGRIAVFGKSRGVGEQLGETLALRGSFEDAQRVST